MNMIEARCTQFTGSNIWSDLTTGTCYLSILQIISVKYILSGVFYYSDLCSAVRAVFMSLSTIIVAINAHLLRRN